MSIEKVLIAVDASENSERAVAYVGRMLGCMDGNFHVELLCVVRPPDRDMFKDEESWRSSCSMKEEQKRGFMKKAKAMLLDAGLPGDAVSEKMYCGLGTSIARHILDEQKSGGFGTIVVGRRGVSKAEEFLFGSVSNKIVHYAEDCTVWVVQ